MKADGRWRIFVFGDMQDPTDPGSATYRFIDFLANDATSPVQRYTPKGADIDSVIDTYTVFQQQGLSMPDLHDYLWPAKGKYGLRDYEKVYHADERNDIYELRGIDRNKGCAVIVRPDQHVATVLPLTEHGKTTEFFEAFMVVVE